MENISETTTQPAQVVQPEPANEIHVHSNADLPTGFFKDMADVRTRPQVEETDLPFDEPPKLEKPVSNSSLKPDKTDAGSYEDVTTTNKFIADVLVEALDKISAFALKKYGKVENPALTKSEKTYIKQPAEAVVQKYMGGTSPEGLLLLSIMAVYSGRVAEGFANRSAMAAEKKKAKSASGGKYKNVAGYKGRGRPSNDIKT